MVKRIGDIEEQLFVSLHDLVFVDVPYLEKYIYVHPDGTAYSRPWISRQMNALQREGYIKSFPVAKASTRGNDRLVYTLDNKGVQEVKEILGESDWDKRWTDRTPTYIYHSLQMSHIQGAYASQKDKVFAFKEFFSERRAFRNYGESSKDKEGKVKQSATTVIRPDGAFVLERTLNEQSIQILYLVELERSRQRIDVTINKLRRYNEYVRKGAYKDDVVFGDNIQLVRVLFVSSNQNERDQLMRNAKKAESREIEKIGGALMFATYDEVLENPYGDIWKAAHSTDQEKLYSLYKRIE
ncbi:MULTISPECIES: replication-relaxation family protein [Cytobacillus]|uniref:replication-relaxation family protein n=1 Tax=Cytobacillus TaxID=2675230 RepID=UPI0025A2CACF|nr:replication-relaxation family protein [Cytobacillus kochii]MDM5205413.1 replication-relaxation family protein [Cytobacillus kochii]